MTRATASAVRVRMPSKSPAVTRSRGTIQEPPTAATDALLKGGFILKDDVKPLRDLANKVTSIQTQGS